MTLFATAASNDPQPWFTPTFIVATLGLIVSILSLITNQQFTLWKERKQEVMKLFIKIHLEVQAFKVAFMEHLIVVRQVQAMNQYLATANPQQAADPANLGQLQQANSAASATQRHLHQRIAELRTNCTAVGLLFDKSGESLGKAIVHYYILANNMPQIPPNLSDNDVENTYLNPRLHAVEQAMEPLWNKVKDWWGHPDLN